MTYMHTNNYHTLLLPVKLQLTGVTADPISGTVFISGYSGEASTTQALGGQDAFVRAYSANGTLLWDTTYG